MSAFLSDALVRWTRRSGISGRSGPDVRFRTPDNRLFFIVLRFQSTLSVSNDDIVC
jgi:hypothetical protein